MTFQPVIAVHGGAWAIPKHLWEDSIQGVKKAVLMGYKVLCNEGSAIDAVEEAIVDMEDNFAFDAGKGSVLTFDEQVEMDALIMEGQHLKAGAVAAIQNIQNPIKVARMVLERTPHVLVVGEGANKFAASQGVKKLPPDSLVTEEAKAELEKYKKFKTTINSLFTMSKMNHDTVGCVALDMNRHVACGTSTGGITAKLPGRVGDSPLVGCGGIADNEVGAVSTTGHGEAIIKVCLARNVLENMSADRSVNSSLEAALDYMRRRVTGYGGAIALSTAGDVGIKFTTERMAWAYVKDHKLHYGLHPNQHEIDDIS